MPSPDLIVPTRLESLLAGAPPESEREAIVQGLVRELRADARPAPAALRERVRALDAPAKPPRLGRRAALAVGVVALLSGGAVLGGLIARSPDRGAAPPVASNQATTTEASGAPVVEPSSGVTEWKFEADPERSANQNETALRDARRNSGGALPKSVFPAPGRAQDVDMAIDLRVSDADELSDATNDAMRATRDLGGLIVSSSVDTGGLEGLARLELRIPVRRLEDAVLRLSSLGTITSQQVATRDLQGGIDRRAGQILALQRAIERDRLILASGTLTPEERLEVELRLADARARVRDLRRDRARLIREASMADLTLTLHTRAAKTDKDEGGIAGAARHALNFLGGAGAVAVFALVVLSPLIALAALIWALLRSRRRRLDDRLLEEPRPHAPPS